MMKTFLPCWHRQVEPQGPVIVIVKHRIAELEVSESESELWKG